MTESEYINLYDDPAAKLIQLRTIIAALDTAMVTVIEKGFAREYMLNDGQVIQSVKRSTIKEITDARLVYIQEANRIIENLEGRSTRLIPNIC